MPKTLEELLLQAILCLDAAEALCPKPVMSTNVGVNIAIAASHTLAAYKKVKGI